MEQIFPRHDSVSILFYSVYRVAYKFLLAQNEKVRTYGIY